MAFGGKTLTVYLAADLKKWNKGVSDAEGGLKGFAGNLKNMLGPALLGAATAVGALATKMAIDGVNAAIEDEAAAAKLAQTLENLGLAHDTAPVEQYISSLEMAYGVADEQLRPAYDRLVRATRNTAKANDTLSLALDVAAGTGKSLDTVVQALGRAYDGNTAGLSRLGAGLDSATLKSGDMTRITKALSDTFGGQAATQADTFQGQLARVSTAADNLKEAFGKGFLTAFTNTGKATDELVQDMKDLEVSMESSGKIIGDLLKNMAGDAMELVKVFGFLTNPGATWNYIWEDIAIDLRGLTEEEKTAARAANDLAYAQALAGDSAETTGDKVASTIPTWQEYDHRVRMTNESFREYLRLNSVRMGIVREENRDYKDLAARQRDVNTYASITLDTTNNLTGSRGAASAAASKQAKAEQSLTDVFKIQQEVVTGLAAKLETERGKLEAAVTAMNDYAATLQENITSGLDLGQAFTNQFDEAGKMTGEGVLQGFQKMVDQADWFGNVLVALKAQKVDDSLIQYMASQGPEVGGALGQQMLGDKGLLSSLNEKWVAVQERTKSLSMQLVPEFMVAGVESGIEMVNGLADQLGSETQRLGRIGALIAKPVGARFKAQLLEDIAAAIREAQAFQSAARAEASAAAASRAVPITEQSAAQALSNLLRNSDQRNGQNIQPVLI